MLSMAVMITTEKATTSLEVIKENNNKNIKIM